MDKLLSFLALAELLVGMATTLHAAEARSPLEFKVKNIKGEEVDLSTYKGKVVLVVNVASKCGYTPQYKGLQEVYAKYKDQGLVVLGFPANEFGKQEPGTNDDIAKFCKDNYQVDFDMFSKIVVKGEGIAPLYQFLTGKDTNPQFAGDIGWNFEKFLIGRNGQVVARYPSKVKPEGEELTKAVEAELGKK